MLYVAVSQNFPCRNLSKLVYLHNVFVKFLQQYYNFHLLLTSNELTLELTLNLTTSVYLFYCQPVWKTDPKTLPLIQFPIEFGYLYFWKFSVNIVVVLGLEETVSKSPALEFDELVVDGKRRQVSILSILSCIFYHQIKKVLFISLSSSSSWTNSRISLFNRFIRSFCSAALFLYDFSFYIWSKFPGTNSFKNVVVCFSSSLKWPLYATQLLFSDPHFQKELHHNH